MFDICKVCFTFGKSNFTNMKSRFLIPRKFRIVGFILFIVGITSFFMVYTAPSYANNIYEINGVAKVAGAYGGCIRAIIMGLLIIGFSKEKVEDEQIAQLRLESLQWSVYINYIILVLCFFLIGGIGLLPVIILNMLTPVVFFIIRFRWKIFQNNRLIKE
ncbi:hypothetical protein SAMN05421821_114121 [Mucilaginibacter lappiensis]|nr:hypothetical protein SAMN05421821_114121 [Mucilaginibacter lappiensis]